MTLRLYSDSNNYHPGEITPAVEMFFNYLSIDGEFLPIAGVFRAEYNFWSKELHTLLYIHIHCDCRVYTIH